MQLTEHYKLRKALDNEIAEIEDIRYNMDAIDAALFATMPKALKGAAGGVAELDSGGKVPAAQLPAMNYDPAGSAAAVQANLNAHANNKSNPHGVTAAQIGAAPATSTVPIGAILMWSGAAAAIPAGWKPCDGANGTPDLRDRFILGAGGSYAVGDKGGAASVTLTEAQMPRHSHGLNTYYSAMAGSNSYTTVGSNSTTQITNGTIQSSGDNQPHENRPPYYALCFIMFKGA